MKKSKFLSILISLLSVGVLASCGGGTPVSEEPTSEAPSSVISSEEEPSAEVPSEEQTSEEAPSEEQTSEEATSEEQTSEEATSEEATSEEESSEEQQPVVYYVINDGEPVEAEDIKGSGSTNKGEYKLNLKYEDVVKFYLDEEPIHYYHWDATAQQSVDDGAEYAVKASGDHMFYYNDKGEMYLVGPEVIVGKPQLGVFPKDLWTEDVEANYISFGRQEGFSYNYAYAAKDEAGIYFYIRQAVVDFNNTGDGWWQRDNVEIRLCEYMNSEDTRPYTQLWASTLNGGSYSEHVSGKVRMTPKASEDELCMVEYELKIEYFDGFTYETEIYPLMMANIVGGCYFSGATSGWIHEGGNNNNGCKGRSPIDPVITHNKGLVAPDLGEGTELLTENVSRSDTAWNSRILDYMFDSTKDILMKVEGDFELEQGTNDYEAGVWDRGFAGDVYSHSTNGTFGDYGEGSVTWRNDWCMNNPWTTENGGEGGSGANTRYVYVSDGLIDNWFTFRRSMHATIYVHLNANVGVLNICTYLTSNSLPGAKAILIHSTPVVNQGRSLPNYINNFGQGIGVGFGKMGPKDGGNVATVTFTSAILYYGTQI